MEERISVTVDTGNFGLHTVLQLTESGYGVVVLDNFYSGHEWAVPKQAKYYENNVLGWKPTYNDLATIYKSAFM